MIRKRRSHSQMFFKRDVLKNSQYLQENINVSVSLIKLKAWRCATLLKRGSNTDGFLSILRNFWTPPHPEAASVLYKLKRKDRLCKSVLGGIFHFRLCFNNINVYFFVQRKAWTLWLENVVILFKIKIIQKPHMFLLPDLLILSCNKKF